MKIACSLSIFSLCVLTSPNHAYDEVPQRAVVFLESPSPSIMLAPGDPYVFTNQESISPRLLKPALTLYRSWDMAESDGKWEDAFTEECTLIMGPTPSKGRKAIKAFRDASINATKGPIIDLEHQVDKYYVMSGSPEDDSGEVEIIMCGTIWYLLKSGKKNKVVGGLKIEHISHSEFDRKQLLISSSQLIHITSLQKFL